MATSNSDQMYEELFDSFIVGLDESEEFKQHFIEELKYSIGKCDTAEHSFEIRLDATFLPENDEKIQYLIKLREQIDNELKEDVKSDMKFEEILNDIDTLNFVEDLFENIVPMDEEDEVQIIGEFIKTERKDPMIAAKESFINAVSEDMRNNNSLLSYSKIQKLNERYRSAMVQYTLFHAQYLVCFGCFDGVILKTNDGLFCPGCNSTFSSTMDINSIKENIKMAITEHSKDCEEIFCKFGWNPLGYFYVMCQKIDCPFYQTINI